MADRHLQAVVSSSGSTSLSLSQLHLAPGQILRDTLHFALNNSGQSHEKPWAQALKAEVADFGSINDWLKLCQINHKRSGPRKRSLPSGLKVIDCETRHIVSATEDLKYLGLSYMWGSVLSMEPNYRVNSALPNALPQVIYDAIEVTRKLRYPYLWVDRYYIDQSNHDEKHSQIRLMESIYQMR